MSSTLTRRQAALLGIVVILALLLGGIGLSAIAARQGLWAETYDIAVGFADAGDLTPGTPVRVRGVEAGQVVAVDYPADDGPVLVRMKLQVRFRGRLYADAAARVQPTGLLGSKVVAIDPGTSAAGPLETGLVRAAKTADIAAAAEKLSAVADEAEKLLKELRTGHGTFARLVNDDGLYRELTGLAGEARAMTRKADGAIDTVKEEAAGVRGLVRDGQETLRSVRQGTDALQRMPLVRNYVENATALLVRPECKREVLTFTMSDIFEPGTAIFNEAGKVHLAALIENLKRKNADPAYAKAEIVVAAFCDPADPTQTATSATELTRVQAQTMVDALKSAGVHKLGVFSRRTMTPIGLGTGPSPVVETERLPPSRLQVLLFTPQ